LARPFTADSHTAGATTLLLQVALPVLLFSLSAPATGTVTAESSVSAEQPATDTASGQEPEAALLTLRGGTNALNAPPVDYTQHVFLPFLRQHLGLNPTLEVRKRGFFPRGGGELFLRIPVVRGPLPAFDLTAPPGPVTRIRGRAFVAGVLPIVVAKKMARGANEALRSAELPALKAAWPPIEIEELKEKEGDASGTGSGIFLWAETENGCVYGASAIGAKGRDAEKVGKEAAYELLKAIEGEGCVDEYLQVSWDRNRHER
jgi:RNA 3'-terminal phosphate cyclase (ATP)